MISEAQKILIDWLKSQTPDEWHRVAMSWNWDNAFDGPNWSVSQADCGRATAQHFFWSGEPAEFLKFPNREAVLSINGHSVGNFDLLKSIADKWQHGLFIRSEPGFSGSVFNASHYFERDYREEESIHTTDRLPWHIGDDIFEVWDGRYVHSDDYEGGYPPEMATRLRTMGVSF